MADRMGYSATLIKAKEETEARTVFRSPKTDSDSPDYESQSYEAQIDDVWLMREVHGGTKTMRAKGKKYLPGHPMEDKDKYKARLAQAVAYNAVRKTLEGLTGMIFRRDPSLSDDVDALLAAHLENVDLRGNKLAVFLRNLAENALLDGHQWVVVDAPPTAGFRNRREAEDAGVRPYWVNVTKKQAINWRYEIRNGHPTLTLFVYREGATVPDGEFGEKSVERIRVLREGELGADGVRGNVRGELWELREREKEEPQWMLIKSYEIDITEIPVVFVASEKAGDYESRPPLLDLAYEQIEHYRVRSDRQKSLTFSSIAVPYCFGKKVTDDEGNAKVSWGPEGFLLVNDPEAKAGVIESHGFGLDATKEELREIKENMASLGLKMLVRPQGVNPQTATAELLGKSESSASLAAFAITLEDATNELLRLHSAFETAIEGEPGTVTINRDFHEQLIDPQFIKALSELVGAGRMSLDTMWQILVEGELLPEDFDPDEERARIAGDGVAGLMDVLGEPDEVAA